MYMWGSSTSTDSDEHSRIGRGPHTLPAEKLKYQYGQRARFHDVVPSDDEANGMDKEHGGKGRAKVDCKKFQRDVKDVCTRSLS